MNLSFVSVPKIFNSPQPNSTKMSSPLGQAQMQVDQLKAQASIERMKVSEASQRYVPISSSFRKIVKGDKSRSLKNLKGQHPTLLWLFTNTLGVCGHRKHDMFGFINLFTDMLSI